MAALSYRHCSRSGHQHRQAAGQSDLRPPFAQLFLPTSLHTFLADKYLQKRTDRHESHQLLCTLTDSLQVLTAGIDGQLHLLPMEWERGSHASTSPTCYSDQQGYVSYHAAQWSSADTFVTASTTGNISPAAHLLPASKPICQNVTFDPAYRNLGGMQFLPCHS